MTDFLTHPTLLQVTRSLHSRQVTPLPEFFLRGEKSGDPIDESQEILASRAEARAHSRQRRKGSRLLRGTDRQYAEALHREADNLHYKGDFETALVLYYRAASVCPRDSSHGVAARRTAAVINALAQPSKAINRLLPRARNGAQESAVVCPESAALRASEILKEVPDPVAVVPQILGFFDGRADFWRTPKPRIPRIRKSLVAVEEKAMKPVTNKIGRMERALNSGHPITVLRIGEEVLDHLSNDSTPESVTIYRCEATVHRLNALAHVILGRHDRATASAAKMTHAVSLVNVSALTIRALVTLGKVHLTFGHLNAAARAWESLVSFVSEPVPKAWLYHEMGRCHMENGDHEKAHELAFKCLDSAERVKSKKWMFYGRLLLGQTMAQLGRFAEAVCALKELDFLGNDVADNRTIAYVRDLAENVTRARESRIQDRDFDRNATVTSDLGFEDGEKSERGPPGFIGIATTDSEFEPTPGYQKISKFRSAAAAGDSGDLEEQDSPFAKTLWVEPRVSRDSIPTGRTYGVTSPIFRRSQSSTVACRNCDVSDSEMALSDIICGR